MQPRISVIIAIYKVEKYLKPCLESILCQTYTEFELILIEDGSPDGCGAICDEYAALDNRVRVIHQPNQGISAVRNKGIREACGEYLIFVDGDDTVHPDMLLKAINGVNQFNADIVVYHYQAVDTEGKFLYSAPIDLPENEPFSVTDKPEVLLSPASLCNKLIKKDVYQDILFPANAWYEDLWMTPRLYMNAQKMVYIGKQPLYNYVIHQGSIMRSGDLNKLYKDRTAALIELLSFFHSNGHYAQFKEELEALTTMHGYFYASMEILQVGVDRPQLNRFRSFVKDEFPDFNHNRYMRRISAKERLQFTLLYHKQYAILRLLSRLKSMAR